MTSRLSVRSSSLTPNVAAEWIRTQEEGTVALKIPGKGPDKRVEQILHDPKTYFENARQKARIEVQAERAQERARFRRRPA